MEHRFINLLLEIQYMERTKIFFAGSMYGGRQDEDLYKELVEELKKSYELLSDHVAYGEKENLDDNGIYEKNIRLIGEADLLIAEVSTPSIGVGYEVAAAIRAGKTVICLYRNGAKARISSMVNGNPHLKVIRYDSVKEAMTGINKIVEGL